MTEFERISVYSIEGEDDHGASFRCRSGNSEFRRSWLTYLTLAFLLGVYPAQALLFPGDTSAMLQSLNQGTLMVVLVVTIVMQWAVFLLLYASSFREQTGLAGLGFQRLRLLDLAWAGAFLLAAFAVTSGLAWSLAQLGMPMPGEISLLVPSDPAGRIVWIIVSVTAGVCEETAFRGYLMTRLRLLGRFRSWAIPTVISAVAFGICHAYQGLPGFIVITAYGVMLSILYIRTGSLWPPIIAHFFQDFAALFVPQ